MKLQKIIAATVAVAAWLPACREAAGDAVVPCTGCTLDVPPARARPRPLLVVLHGDGETAEVAAARWRAAARGRGWAVLSLQCPRAKGCTETSWYKWGGPAQWVIDQVQAVEAKAQIDPRRIYLAGWSGGATFIGSNMPAWPAKFAALVLHGGGQPPASEACPARVLPAYFLVGDQNPIHPAAKRLRSYLEGCGGELRWDLRKGADHAAEDRALDRKTANAILGWLAARPRPAIVSAR